MRCGWKGKRPYSRSDAIRAMRVLQRLGEDDHLAPLNVYRCGLCQRWHVGHTRRQLNKAS